MEDLDEIITILRKFVSTNFLEADASIGASTALLDDGIVDSLGMIDLVEFIEHRFDFVLDDGDMVGENFATLDAMAKLVRAAAIKPHG